MYKIDIDEKFQEKIESLKSEKIMKLIKSESDKFIKKIGKKVNAMKNVEDFQKSFIKCEIATNIIGKIFISESDSDNFLDVESSLILLKIRICGWSDAAIENIKNQLESKNMH